MTGRARHAVGVIIGLAACPAPGFMLLKAATALEWIGMQTTMLTAAPRGEPPIVGVSVGGSVAAAAWLAGACALAGVLAAWPRLSPFAPLAAGLPFVVLGLYAEFDLLGAAQFLRNLGLSRPQVPASEDLLVSGICLLLGGTLLVASAMPWRWAGTAPRPTQWAHRHAVGALTGILAVPAIWYLVQLSDPVGYYAMAGRSVRVHYLNLLPELAFVIAVGALAAARWLSPLASLIAGLPLLAVGLLLVLVPTRVSDAVARFVFFSQPLQPNVGQSVALGAYVLFGGLLAVSALTPWRWRGTSTSPSPGTVAATGPVQP